jgi:DoxX-like family
MQPIVSKSKLWTGRIISGLAVAFLLIDSVMKLMRANVSVQATIQLGYPEGFVVPIGVVLLVCTLLYVIPRTSIWGAVLLTAYLGGAVATQVRAGTPIISNALFPVYVGVMVWGGLYLRDNRLGELISSRKRSTS